MFNKIIERINKRRHYGLNWVVWDWVKFHCEEAGVSFIDYMFKKTYRHFVIVDLDNKSMVYESGFASYTIFDSIEQAEKYAKENYLQNTRIIEEVAFLESLGLETHRIFTLKRFKKIWK